jgi:hypothetical protein
MRYEVGQLKPEKLLTAIDTGYKSSQLIRLHTVTIGMIDL